MSSTLIAHSSKHSAKLTTYDMLASLPVPQALGPYHKPVSHVRLIDAFRQEIHARDYRIDREQFALAAKGNALFGVIDLAPVTGQSLTTAGVQRSLSIGFRNAVDMSMGIRAVAGSHVFVCDNMALSGSMFAIQRKNTTGLDLGFAIAAGFDKFLIQSEILTVELERLAVTAITDGDAKSLVYDAMRARVIPSRLFDDVDRFYFEPVKTQAPECEPRSLFGLHNAFTRAMRDLTPVRRFGASVALGRLFGLEAPQTATDDVIDVEPVNIDDGD